MDIEGSERNILADWAEKGLLNNIKQIGVEFHSYQKYRPAYKDIFAALHRAGFKLISYDPNLCGAPTQLFELVFRKTELQCV